MSEAVSVWLYERGLGRDAAWPIGEWSIGEDAPIWVLDYVQQRANYLKALDVWFTQQPIDRDCGSDRFRLFGGPWIPHYKFDVSIVVTHADLTVRVQPFIEYTLRVKSGQVPEEKLRQYAAGLYKWVGMTDRVNTQVAELFCPEFFHHEEKK